MRSADRKSLRSRFTPRKAKMDNTNSMAGKRMAKPGIESPLREIGRQGKPLPKQRAVKSNNEQLRKNDERHLARLAFESEKCPSVQRQCATHRHNHQQAEPKRRTEVRIVRAYAEGTEVIIQIASSSGPAPHGQEENQGEKHNPQ